MVTMNRQVLLAARPQGAVSEANFRIVDAPVPKPGDGEVLVKNEWLSLDPYMRGRMNEAKSYATPVAIGEVMVGQTVGEVVESRDPALKPGDKVLTSFGWQLYGAAKAKTLRKIDVARAHEIQQVARLLSGSARLETLMLAQRLCHLRADRVDRVER